MFCVGFDQKYTNSFSVILISVECRFRFSYESYAVVCEGDGKWAKIIHTHAKESARIVVIQCPQRISTKIRVQYVPEFGTVMIKRWMKMTMAIC